MQKLSTSRRSTSHDWFWFAFAASKHSKSRNGGEEGGASANWNPWNTTNTGWLQEWCSKPPLRMPVPNMDMTRRRNKAVHQWSHMHVRNTQNTWTARHITSPSVVLKKTVETEQGTHLPRPRGSDCKPLYSLTQACLTRTNQLKVQLVNHGKSLDHHFPP